MRASGRARRAINSCAAVVDVRATDSDRSAVERSIRAARQYRATNDASIYFYAGIICASIFIYSGIDTTRKHTATSGG